MHIIFSNVYNSMFSQDQYNCYIKDMVLSTHSGLFPQQTTTLSWSTTKLQLKEELPTHSSPTLFRRSESDLSSRDTKSCLLFVSHSRPPSSKELQAYLHHLDCIHWLDESRQGHLLDKGYLISDNIYIFTIKASTYPYILTKQYSAQEKT